MESLTFTPELENGPDPEPASRAMTAAEPVASGLRDEEGR